MSGRKTILEILSRLFELAALAEILYEIGLVSGNQNDMEAAELIKTDVRGIIEDIREEFGI